MLPDDPNRYYWDLARAISLTQDNRRAFSRQSFISTGAGAFFFGATGAAVNSDCSLFGVVGEVVSSDGSSFGGTDGVVSSDGSLFGADDVVSSAGSWFAGTGAAAGFDGSAFGATGMDVSSVGRGRGNGISNGARNEPSRRRLPSVPVTPVNQVETPCAIPDRGDRGDCACASTDAAASVTRTRKYLVAFKTRTCMVSVRSGPNKLPG